MTNPTPMLEGVTTLGDAVRVLREARGLTLREVARRAGVSAPFLSDIEHNRRSTQDKLTALAEVLEVPVESLKQYRISPELKDWLAQNPQLGNLLDQYRLSGKSLENLLQALRTVQAARRRASR